MKILILSFYYTPDLSAGSFRTTALVASLQKKLPAGSRIDVMTTQPNRYHSYEQRAQELETEENVSIRRIPLPDHSSGMLDQSRAFLRYFTRVYREVGTEQYDLVYATSSRLFTAVLGAVVADKLKAPLYLDIRDIFVDTIKDVLSKKISWLFLPAFSFLEKRSFRKAACINLVSPGFKTYFEDRYGSVPLDFFTNGIDGEFLNALSDKPDKPESRHRKTIVYAGNIGEGQGLHHIVPDLAKATEAEFDFLIVGDGGRRNQLVDALNEKDIKNVTLKNPVKRSELISIYRQADILFLHLNDCDAFRKVLPSKIFEYAALGKPVLAGVAGYAAEFICEQVENAEVFEPCSGKQALDALNRLQVKDIDRQRFIDEYRRTQIMDRMADKIIHVITQSTADHRQKSKGTD